MLKKIRAGRINHMEVREVELKAHSLPEAREYIEDRLLSMGQPKSSVMEAVVVFEEVFMAAIHQNANSNITAKVTVENRFGEVTVKLFYEGERFQIDKLRNEEFSAGILNGFRDKMFTVYRRGINSITVRVQNCRRMALLRYVFIFLLALATSAVVRQMGDAAKDFVQDKFVLPIISFMLNAVLLISTPLAFFTLVKNIITLINANRRRTDSGKIILQVALQSMLAILISMLAVVLLSKITVNTYAEYYAGFRITELEELMSLDLIGFFFPSGIDEFFSLTKPFAFISLAILTALAICNSEEYFDTLRHAVEAISAMLCKMLNIVLTILPLAYFAAILDDVLFFSAAGHILEYSFMVLYVVLIVAILFGVYCIAIKARGGNPVGFIRKSLPAIKENIRIGSSIDAVPYNIRFLNRTFHIPVKDLSDNLPVLAQVSQAGNCLCFTVISMAFLFLCNEEYTPIKLGVVAVMSLFMGIGSPGQQGGILAGALIINAFLGIPLMETVSVAIIWEILFGPLATFVNTWGDIVIVYARHLKKQKTANRDVPS